MAKVHSLSDKTILIPAIWDSFRKLDPRLMVRNPVMFVALVGAVVTTLKLLYTPLQGGFRLLRAGCRLALVYRVVRQLCRGHGRRAG